MGFSGPTRRLTTSFPTPFPEEYMPTKTTDGKAGAKKPAAKAGAKKAAGSKPNALQQPLQPSKELAAIVGTNPLPRGEVVSKMWEYIKKNNLQNPENKREILADDKLKPIFGKPKVTMFEMNKHLAQHLK
jgi:upstream activation factor subunit UAF30